MTRRILRYEAEQVLNANGLTPLGPYRGATEPWECLCDVCGDMKIIRLSVLKHRGK